MYFKISKSANDQYYFEVVASGNNQTLCTSETYEDKTDVENAIKIIIDEAKTAIIKDTTKKSLWDDI